MLITEYTHRISVGHQFTNLKFHEEKHTLFIVNSRNVEHNDILHIPRQHCCHGICKISSWSSWVDFIWIIYQYWGYSGFWGILVKCKSPWHQTGYQLSSPCIHQAHHMKDPIVFIIVQRAELCLPHNTQLFLQQMLLHNTLLFHQLILHIIPARALINPTTSILNHKYYLLPVVYHVLFLFILLGGCFNIG